MRSWVYKAEYGMAQVRPGDSETMAVWYMLGAQRWVQSTMGESIILRSLTETSSFPILGQSRTLPLPHFFVSGSHLAFLPSLVLIFMVVQSVFGRSGPEPSFPVYIPAFLPHLATYTWLNISHVCSTHSTRGQSQQVFSSCGSGTTHSS